MDLFGKYSTRSNVDGDDTPDSHHPAGQAPQQHGHSQHPDDSVTQPIGWVIGGVEDDVESSTPDHVVPATAERVANYDAEIGPVMEGTKLQRPYVHTSDPARVNSDAAMEALAFDRWLTWKHGAQSSDRLIRSLANDERQTRVVELDWGDQRLLEASVELIAPVATDVVAYFYHDLFARLPGLRQLFPADMSTQRERLLTALIALVVEGAEPATLVPVLEQLGRDHRKFGARAAQYDAVGAALIAALSRYAGRGWTPEVERAWLARYGAAATLMIRAADEDQHQPPFWYGTVTGHEMCGGDVAILRLRPHLPYPYVAGQYATLESPRLPRVWRPYSMATAPKSDQVLEFHVRAIGRGGVSDALVASNPGDVVRIGPPQGTVTMGGAAERSLLFVAGGTGWSTVKALLEAWARNRTLRVPSRLLVGCRPGEPYDPRFEHFVRSLPDISTTLVHSADGLRAEMTPHRLPGRDLDAFVAGPPGLVQSATTLLNAAGVPNVRIHHDHLQPV